MKDDYTTNSHYLMYTFLLKGLGDCTFEHRSERVTSREAVSPHTFLDFSSFLLGVPHFAQFHFVVEVLDASEVDSANLGSGSRILQITLQLLNQLAHQHLICQPANNAHNTSSNNLVPRAFSLPFTKPEKTLGTRLTQAPASHLSTCK